MLCDVPAGIRDECIAAHFSLVNVGSDGIYVNGMCRAHTGVKLMCVPYRDENIFASASSVSSRLAKKLYFA